MIPKFANYFYYNKIPHNIIMHCVRACIIVCIQQIVNTSIQFCVFALWKTTK